MERARFKAHLEAFEQQLKAEGKSSNTLTSYTRDVREFLAYLAAGPYPEVIDEITEGQIAGFLASLKDRELAERSKAKKLTSIRSFMLFTRRTGLVRTYPPKLTYAKIKPLVRALLAGPPPAPVATEVTDQRRFIRVPFFRAVKVRAINGEWVAGYGFEIGRGGIGLRVAHVPRADDGRLEVQFTLADDAPVLTAVGHIRFVDDTILGEGRVARIGISFVELDENSADILAHWIADRLTGLTATASPVASEVADRPTAGEIRSRYRSFERFKDARLAAAENTRAFVRVPLDVDAFFRVEGNGADVYEGVTVDLGLNGLSIKSRYCPAGDGTPLILTFPVAGHDVRVSGRIVNKVDYEGDQSRMTRIGIQFTEVPDGATGQISEFIRARLVRPTPAVTAIA